jgi:hypothetical protein
LVNYFGKLFLEFGCRTEMKKVFLMARKKNYPPLIFRTAGTLNHFLKCFIETSISNKQKIIWIRIDQKLFQHQTVLHIPSFLLTYIWEIHYYYNSNCNAVNISIITEFWVLNFFLPAKLTLFLLTNTFGEIFWQCKLYCCNHKSNYISF